MAAPTHHTFRSALPAALLSALVVVACSSAGGEQGLATNPAVSSSTTPAPSAPTPSTPSATSGSRPGTASNSTSAPTTTLPQRLTSATAGDLWVTCFAESDGADDVSCPVEAVLELPDDFGEHDIWVGGDPQAVVDQCRGPAIVLNPNATSTLWLAAHRTSCGTEPGLGFHGVESFELGTQVSVVYDGARTRYEVYGFLQSPFADGMPPESLMADLVLQNSRDSSTANILLLRAIDE